MQDNELTSTLETLRAENATEMNERISMQAIIGLHVAVAAAESNAEARHAAIEPFVVAQAQRLTQPIADTARSQLELFGDALADQ